MAPENDLNQEATGTAPSEPVADACVRAQQIQRALASIRALAIVLARQAAREDDATERKATDTGAEPQDPHNGLIISDGG